METVKDMRQKILDFVKSSGGWALRQDIKNHLGLDEMGYSELFTQALKTKKLIPIYGTGEISPGLFLSRPPIVAYKRASLL